MIDGTVPLLDVMARSIDLPRALHRGRYMMAVARQERLGLPIDGEYLARLAAHWERLQLHFIAQDDEFGLYDGTSFREQRLWDLIEARHWDWPLTEHGRPGLQRKVLAQQARRYPELKRLMRLRDSIAELRISRLSQHDRRRRFQSRARCCRSGPARHVASHRRGTRVFLPSLPSWLHGLLRPPPGFALVELDWTGQGIRDRCGAQRRPRA